MAENLVIVESPAKAKTIEKFLGKDYIVKSSFGHVRDLSKKELGIDIEHGFTPLYEISSDKKKLVTELRKLVKDAKTVWLASDEDREGEAIAWHLFEVLKLKDSSTKRIVFHEITKNAILHAIETPRTIDKPLVDAQQARRVLDRIVGYEVSPVLWRKVKPSLSAGRVQSVAVRIIVEREREIIAFVPESTYKVSAYFKPTFNGKSYSFRAEMLSKITEKSDAQKVLEACKNVAFEITDIQKKSAKKSPAAPFTTSTLQQEASRKLGFSVSKTMMVAQSLYESGLITYMRTDSVNLSDLAISAAEKEITEIYGKEYAEPRRYQSNIKGAQEAHEAIRPTYLNNKTIEGSYDEQRLYELVWKRTIASQMSNATLEKTTISLNPQKSPNLQFVAKGEIITFEGFLKVYKESTDDEIDETDEAILPPLKVGDKLDYDLVNAHQRFSHHQPRYTEASLVKKLEDLGIGRPSTYAPTISTILKRGYVVKEDKAGVERKCNLLTLKNDAITETSLSEVFGAEKSKILPTDIGMVVNDFLIKNFNDIVDYNFTANIEKEFDTIAEGKMEWNSMIGKFYEPFHKTVENTIEKSERGNGERILGVDPESGKNVIARIGKYGPMVQLGNTEDEDKPHFASLSKGQLLETITLDEALKLLKYGSDGIFIGVHPESGKNITARIGRFGPFLQLGESSDSEKPQYASLKKEHTIDTITLADAIEYFKLPKVLGEFEGSEVVANTGKFGPYLAHKGTFTSIKKGEPAPLEISLERAIELIIAKRENDERRTIQLFEEDKNIKVVLDRWNHPSVYYKRKYYRLAPDVDGATLTLQQCYDLVGIKKEPKAESTTKKSKTKK